MLSSKKSIITNLHSGIDEYFLLIWLPSKQNSVSRFWSTVKGILIIGCSHSVVIFVSFPDEWSKSITGFSKKIKLLTLQKAEYWFDVTRYSENSWLMLFGWPAIKNIDGIQKIIIRTLKIL